MTIQVDAKLLAETLAGLDYIAEFCLYKGAGPGEVGASYRRICPGNAHQPGKLYQKNLEIKMNMTRAEMLSLVSSFDRSTRHYSGCPRCGAGTTFLGWGQACVVCGWRSDRNEEIGKIQRLLRHDVLDKVGVLDETLERVVQYILSLYGKRLSYQPEESLRIITEETREAVRFSHFPKWSLTTFVVVEDSENGRYVAYYEGVDSEAPRGVGDSPLSAIADLCVSLLSSEKGSPSE